MQQVKLIILCSVGYLVSALALCKIYFFLNPVYFINRQQLKV